MDDGGVMATAREWIERLGMKPHPEGGYYLEVYRSSRLSGDGVRPCSTAIYYLLEAGDFSAFHSLTSDEIWHHYQGEPLAIHLLGDGGGGRTVFLGKNPAGDQRPLLVVPAGCIFAAEPAAGGGEGYSLVGCTVSPGFRFEDFVLLPRRELLERFPDRDRLIRRLTRD